MADEKDKNVLFILHPSEVNTGSGSSVQQSAKVDENRGVFSWKPQGIP